MKKFLVTIIAIGLLIIASTSNAFSLIHVQAQTPSTWHGNVIAQPPHARLISSFNPSSIFNPATPTGGAPFCQLSGGGTILCYPPNFLRTAYDFPGSTGSGAIDGTGQTIIIVDAFGSPTIQSDLAIFDGSFSISAPPSFKILCGPTWTGNATLDSCPVFDATNGDQVGWAEETTLDVTMAHALAPGANIVLVISNDDMWTSFHAAELAVVTQPSLRGSIMSQSFGQPDDLVGCDNYPCTNRDPTIKAIADDIYRNATLNQWTVLASTGDDGANEAYSYVGTSELTPSWPATNPYNLAVGGTQGLPYNGQYRPAWGGTFTCAAGGTCNTGLVVMKAGSLGCTNSSNWPGLPTDCNPTGYGGEGAWQEYNYIGYRSSSGGGVSTLYGRPGYQSALPATFATLPSGTATASGRLNPDVSFNAAVDGGVLLYLSFSSDVEGWWIFGGTSAASPAMAAIVALVNQVHGGPAGFINPAIYSLAQSTLYSHSFHDITKGNNTGVLPPTSTFEGFSAGTGYDLTTGWGTLDVAHFVTDIQTYLSALSQTNYYVSLVPGWNLISLPIVPSNTAIKTVLADLIGSKDFTKVWTYQAGTWKYATLSSTGVLSGGLTTMQDGVGYWIYMTRPDMLYVSGYVIPPAAGPPSYSLTLGWNLIGFKPQPTVGQEQVNALPSTGGYLNSINAKYDPNNVWIYDNTRQTWTRATSTTTIQPGQGLWVYMTSAAALYP